MKHSTVLFIIVLLLWSVLGFAQVPREITYQGYLTDNASNPISGNVSLTFTLYDVLSGGNTLWEEVQNPVAVTNGVFRVILGSNTTLDLPFDEPYWLGIKVGNDPELAPRIALTGVGYSFHSLKADSVNHLADGSVTTNKIVNGAVTQIKLAAGVSLPPGGTAGGDLTGSYPNPIVTKIQGYQISNAIPDTNQVLKWNGNMWTPVPNFGIVPIGSIIPWLKSFPNTPPLPEGFLECNGQPIFDPASPYWQAYTPDLNSTHRFLRGSTTSGTQGGSDNHTHGVDIPAIEVLNPTVSSVAVAWGTHEDVADHPHHHWSSPFTVNTGQATSGLPSYYEVVWIMRIK